jgi:hypothetical protein
MPLITSLNVDVHINSLISEAQEPVTNGKSFSVMESIWNSQKNQMHELKYSLLMQ